MAGYIGSKAVLLSTTAATVTGDMKVDVDTLVVDSTNNRVGIGTSSLAERLTVEGNIQVGPNGTASEFQGILVQNGKDSSAASTTSFIDFRNNLGIPDAHLFVRRETDGSSNVIFGTTPAGSRSSDRRSERMRIDSAGRVTMPYQPLCSVAYTDGDITSGTIPFNVVRENNGSHYNSGTGRFTAPIAGYYKFDVSVLTASGQKGGFRMQKNSTSVYQVENTQAASVAEYRQLSGTSIVYCNASDYLSVVVKNGTLYGGGGEYTMMNVHLIG